MSRRRQSLFKDPPSPKDPVPQLTPPQREELSLICSKQERAKWLLRFLSQPTDPQVH